ncbi:UDP-glucose 4-epimerase [Faunimonas pinastri]|uniref:UDP-glucose 4-epimerase n=1 Tax=Faunimonas pinastri TaxID=1855383 RepID=A0A1H9FFP5_9HYPH|nr:NAD-dependent epimerase/dehydratase family protein [Faunimonas pinastri]SEQ36756.1 UDP-glucose 4-epimerase [Faunimonas pinastri]
MRILITGGCGFIGTNLVATLNGAGIHEVSVFDNESMGKREHLAGLKADFISGDLADPDAIHAALEGVDAVVHLAADTRVMDSIADPMFNMRSNVVGTLNLLEAMRARGIMRLVNASTGGAIVGEVEPPVHEEMVPRPASPYGASKLAVEGYCSAYAASYGLKALSLRFANVYGPRSFHKGSVVAAFFKTILAGRQPVVYGDGSQIRDFVFVEDLCRGILSGIERGASGVIQLGSGRPTSLNELLDTMRDVVAPRALEVDYQPFRPGEVVATYCDVSKARRELGFDPSTPLAHGLAQTWDWFLGQRGEAPAA